MANGKDRKQGKGVNQPDEAWERHWKKHQLVRALRQGRDAMYEHAKRYTYMKPNEGELELVDTGVSAPQSSTV